MGLNLTYMFNPLTGKFDMVNDTRHAIETESLSAEEISTSGETRASILSLTSGININGGAQIITVDGMSYGGAYSLAHIVKYNHANPYGYRIEFIGLDSENWMTIRDTDYQGTIAKAYEFGAQFIEYLKTALGWSSKQDVLTAGSNIKIEGAEIGVVDMPTFAADTIEGVETINGLTSGIQGTSADVATQVMGSEWRMPKASELEALLHLSWSSVTINGINCFKVTAANGNYIYIPKSGYINNATQTYVGQRLCYLASEIFSTSIINAAIALTTTSSGANSMQGTQRYIGSSIRAVSSTSNDGVDLGTGIKWATHNVGAANPENYGNYYAFGELATKSTFSWTNYLCIQAKCGTTEDPLSHVTKPVTSTVLHKDNTAAHLNPVKEARWDGKQDALGFVPENTANKVTSLSSSTTDLQYPSAKATVDFVQNSIVGINDYISSSSTMKTAFEGCSRYSAAPTKLEQGSWYKDGNAETININKGDWAIVLSDETVCWFNNGVFRYERFKDGGISPFGYVVLHSGTAVAGTKGENACIEIDETSGAVKSYIYSETVGENTYLCFLDNSEASAITWKIQSLTNTIGAVHKYVDATEQGTYDLHFPTTRYICDGHDGNNNPIWALLFIVNDNPTTQAQWEVLESRVTAEWKEQVDSTLSTLGTRTQTLETTVELKANKVASFQANPDNDHYPTEKLVKDISDTKRDKIVKETRGENASRELQPNKLIIFENTLSSFNISCVNGNGEVAEYMCRFTADTAFSPTGTDNGVEIIWTGDVDCEPNGIYEVNIVDHSGIITKMN